MTRRQTPGTSFSLARIWLILGAMRCNLPLLLLSFVLLAAPLRAQSYDVPLPPNHDLTIDDDEGMGTFSVMVPHFDPVKGVGTLMALTAGGGHEELEERPGEMVQHLYDLEVEGVSLVLVVWRHLKQPGIRSLEVWTLDGAPSLVWGAPPRPYWFDAQIVVRERKGRWLVQVTRSLAGENQEEPLLRSREIYQVLPSGLKVLKLRRQTVTTASQRLNLIADLALSRDWEAMISQVQVLPKRPPEFLQRATLVLTRHLPRRPGEAQPQAEELLRMLAAQAKSEKIAVAAGNQLLERSWKHSRQDEPWSEESEIDDPEADDEEGGAPEAAGEAPTGVAPTGPATQPQGEGGP